MGIVWVLRNPNAISSGQGNCKNVLRKLSLGQIMRRVQESHSHRDIQRRSWNAKLQARSIRGPRESTIHPQITRDPYSSWLAIYVRLDSTTTSICFTPKKLKLNVVGCELVLT